MRDKLDATAIRQWCAACVDALEAHRAELDALNLFPVPDGDTGTNLALTLHSAAEAMRHDASTDVAAALQTMAHGALVGARGNSGVIVSQLLRGLAEGLDGAAYCDGIRLSAGLRLAAERAYAAVSRPLEGTILTVARAAAEGAERLRELADPPLYIVLDAARGAAAEALDRTTSQLPALSRAGVVDAGGKGLVVLLDALAGVVSEAIEAAADTRPVQVGRVVPHASPHEMGSVDFGYEVQYLLDADDLAIDALRSRLDELGDSVVIVGSGAGAWNVHAHVNDVGAAIEAGVEAGRPRQISVVRFADQISSGTGGIAVVAIAPGEGLAHLFSGEGVHVVEGGAGASPSTGQVLEAMRATGAPSVVLLPNSRQVVGVAEAAAEQARARGCEVAVVPTHSPVQGLAAVAVHDPNRRFGDDVVAMAEAAAATHWAEITVAEQEALTVIGRCQPGDVLGLIDGEVVEMGADVDRVAIAVLDRLLPAGAELVTLVLGADAKADLGERLRAHVAAADPLLDVSVYNGGQPYYPLLIGLE